MALRSVRLWIGVPALLLGVAVVTPLPERAAAAGPAEITPAAGEATIGASGAFATSVPIDVPDFRGLEPNWVSPRNVDVSLMREADDGRDETEV